MVIKARSVGADFASGGAGGGAGDGGAVLEKFAADGGESGVGGGVHADGQRRAEKGVGVRQLQVRLLEERRGFLRKDAETCLAIGVNGVELSGAKRGC